MSDFGVPWHPRGIGLDDTPGCFVCGTTKRHSEANDYMNNIAAGVSLANEQASLNCFARGARMDYYHGDHNVPQIKVGACDKHLDVLQHIQGQWFISRKKIDELVQLVLRREEREAQDANRGR
jgi:hypothetical protein